MFESKINFAFSFSEKTGAWLAYESRDSFRRVT
jgi:hypothetical protein